MGTSVNDLCCVSFKLLLYIHDFTVQQQILSDHLPIVLSCYINNLNSDATLLPLTPKLNFNEKYKEAYSKNINGMINATNLCLLDGDKEITKLIKIIQTSAGKTKVNNKINNLSQMPTWYDWECHKIRMKVFKFLNIFRRKDTNFTKQLYTSANKQYNKLKQNKRKQFHKNNEEAIINIKDSKQFLNQVKRWKNKAFRVGTINVKSWLSHFQRLLNIKTNDILECEGVGG
jgi:hypothetical protein